MEVNHEVTRGCGFNAQGGSQKGQKGETTFFLSPGSW